MALPAGWCPTQHLNYSVCEAEVYDFNDDTQNLVSLVHIICSALSALCCLAVLIASRMNEQLRMFPKSMLLWKTFCDLLTALCVIGINGVLYNRTTCGHNVCKGGVLDAGLTAALVGRLT